MTYNNTHLIPDAEDVYSQIRGEQCTLGRVGASTLSAVPDYTVQDQTPFIIRTGKWQLEPARPKFSNQDAAGEWYTIKGKRGVLQPGDILTPTGKTAPTTTPPVTFISQHYFGAALGLKTARTGDIYNGNTIIFHNIAFDYLPETQYPGSPLDREVQSSLGVPTLQVVMFKRPTLRTAIQDPEGLFLYQTDTAVQVVWEIKALTELTYVYILNLERNVNR